MEEHQRSPRSHMGGYRPRKKTAEPNDSPGRNQFIVEKVDYVYYSRADLPEVSSSHDNRCRVSWYDPHIEYVQANMRSPEPLLSHAIFHPDYLRSPVHAIRMSSSSRVVRRVIISWRSETTKLKTNRAGQDDIQHGSSAIGEKIGDCGAFLTGVWKAWMSPSWYDRLKDPAALQDHESSLFGTSNCN